MQTPEGHVVGMFGPCEKSPYGGCSVHESVWEAGERCRWMRNFADLIRERDAEVRADERAKVLAAFTEERKDRRSCGCRVPVNADWSCCFGAGHTVATERRLIGPWGPTP